MDFPRSNALALPLFASPARYGMQAELAGIANLTPGAPSATTWVANLVAYMPFALPFDYPVNRVGWMNGSTVTTSNADCGIYSAAGVRIYRTGSTTMVGTSVPQYVTPSTPFLLPAGIYYAAWTCDNTTSRAQTFAGSALGGIMVGLLEETTGAFGLPATMTPVRWTRAWGYNAVVLTRTTTGF